MVEKEDLLVALFMALALVTLFVWFMDEVEVPEHENVHQDLLNTTGQYRLAEQTYLKVYFSRSCPACKQQIPVLFDLADKGVFIQLLDVYQFTDQAIADNVTVTPTTYIIGPKNITKLEGFLSRDDLEVEIKRVTDKSNLTEKYYGSESD